jgi:cyclopropane fatty-acyl-phospholipid synthase-like methyltransferase
VIEHSFVAEVLVRHQRLDFGESFIRMWECYLACSEAGFSESYLGSVQTLFAKPRFPITEYVE